MNASASIKIGGEQILPGQNNRVMQPGYVKEALLTATAEMWKSACQAECVYFVVI